MINHTEAQMMLNVQEAIIAVTHWDRQQILKTIIEHKQCPYYKIVNSIKHDNPCREATRHLRQLYNSGIVTRVKMGRNVYYSVNQDAITLLKYVSHRFSKLQNDTI